MDSCIYDGSELFLNPRKLENEGRHTEQHLLHGACGRGYSDTLVDVPSIFSGSVPSNHEIEAKTEVSIAKSHPANTVRSQVFRNINFGVREINVV